MSEKPRHLSRWLRLFRLLAGTVWRIGAGHSVSVSRPVPWVVCRVLVGVVLAFLLLELLPRICQGDVPASLALPALLSSRRGPSTPMTATTSGSSCCCSSATTTRSLPCRATFAPRPASASAAPACRCGLPLCGRSGRLSACLFHSASLCSSRVGALPAKLNTVCSCGADSRDHPTKLRPASTTSIRRCCSCFCCCSSCA
mmetsp:Transcript_30270/g.70636  ORF Transcript_30270/g.70636 Transcript_30270/m.70636 type:complete len:200 (+) Transcript_30270:470-1069(+)